MNVADMIRHARKEKGLSQAKLAGYSGLCKTSITNFESGRRSPKIKDLAKIAKALECSVESLLAG